MLHGFIWAKTIGSFNNTCLNVNMLIPSPWIVLYLTSDAMVVKLLMLNKKQNNR